MSSITIAMCKDRFYFGVDTATSCFFSNDDTIYRVKDKKSQKVYQIGKSVVFSSGTDPKLSAAQESIHKFMDSDGFINEYELRDYLRKQYPNSENPRAEQRNSEVGFSILSIKNGKTKIIGMKQCYNDYEIVTVDTPKSGVNISIDGFKNDELSLQVNKYFGRNNDVSDPQNYFDLYQANYSVEIGGEIRVYEFCMDGLFLMAKKELKESGLRYIDWNFNKLHYINGGEPITSINYDDGTRTFPPKTHTHTSLFDGVGKVTAFGNNFRPHGDSGSGVISCGSPSYLWTQVYAATPTISTSDATLKQQGTSLDDAEKRAALKIKDTIKFFKFNDAVEIKGEAARWHIGVYAQEVKRIFEEEGLDVSNYALFCSDTWYEKDGKAVGKDEKPYTVDDEGVIPVTRLGIRYEELMCFIIAAL
jgi:hypothetical protein